MSLQRAPHRSPTRPHLYKLINDVGHHRHRTGASILTFPRSNVAQDGFRFFATHVAVVVCVGLVKTVPHQTVGARPGRQSGSRCTGGRRPPPPTLHTAATPPRPRILVHHSPRTRRVAPVPKLVGQSSWRSKIRKSFHVTSNSPPRVWFISVRARGCLGATPALPLRAEAPRDSNDGLAWRWGHGFGGGARGHAGGGWCGAPSWRCWRRRRLGGNGACARQGARGAGLRGAQRRCGPQPLAARRGGGARGAERAEAGGVAPLLGGSRRRAVLRHACWPSDAAGVQPAHDAAIILPKAVSGGQAAAAALGGGGGGAQRGGVQPEVAEPAVRRAKTQGQRARQRAAGHRAQEAAARPGDEPRVGVAGGGLRSSGGSTEGRAGLRHGRVVAFIQARCQVVIRRPHQVGHATSWQPGA